MDREGLMYLGVFAAFVVFAAGLLLFQCKMESRTYNKLTGASTTTWDAMWVELRVQDSPRSEIP